MRFLKSVLTVIGLLLVFFMFGCHQPEYMNPYGEDVDFDTVTTGAFQSRTAATTTEFQLATVTTTATTAPMVVVIPEGHKTCPDCGGIRVACANCNGTGKVRAESIDEDTGVYRRHYEDCAVCSVKDPGYAYCDTCQNRLYVPQ